jgi:hypothetical protein
MSDLDELLACGHRKVDALDSYGECVFCKFKARAADYDRLPLDVIGCHDRIEELEAQLEEANTALLLCQGELELARKGREPPKA